MRKANFSAAVFLLLSIPVLLLAQKPEKPDQLYQQGAALALSGKINEAIPVFEKVVTMSPYWSLAHYALGKAYLASGVPENIAKGLVSLKLAADLDKHSADAWFYLGMAYYLKQDYPRAISSYYQAYTIDDTNIAALYNIGAMYDLMGHSPKALLFFKRYYDAKKIEEEYYNF